MSLERLTAAIRDIPDFPRPGILFKDITPILRDAGLFREAVALFVERHRDHRIEQVAGIESRGFIFGAAVAHELGAGFVPVRKAGKLPADTVQVSYDLEYGSATLELHTDAVTPGQRVLVLDDLLATGGTAAATLSLLRQLRAEVVEIDFLVELRFLHGRDRLPDVPVYAPIVFDP